MYTVEGTLKNEKVKNSRPLVAVVESRTPARPWMFYLTAYVDEARNLFRRGQNWGTGDRSPQRGPGAESWWGSGGEAEDIYANNHCNNVLNKNPYFSAWAFPGGHIPLVPPSLRS